MTHCLVLYYSRHGSVARMARLIGRGIESVDGATATLRRVPDLNPARADDQTLAKNTEGLDPVVTLDELRLCDGLALGSPTRFGNMAAPVKAFIDSTAGLWMSGDLVDKPASVFTSTGSLHGGQESTLMTMMVPLIHHGMVIAGIPYTNTVLNTTRSGGTPYGASHLAGHDGAREIDNDERTLCIAQGKRLATLASRLKTPA